MLQVGVVGSSSAGEKELGLAYEAGKKIAESGAALVCGGREGVMEAACRGCKEAGGTTIGILTTVDGSDANEFVDVQIRTGMGFGRNPIVANSSDVLVVVGGSHGTLSEMCFASFEGKPIIGIAGAGGYGEEFGGKKLGEQGKGIVMCEIGKLGEFLDKYLKKGSEK